jgi:SHAQKYF class myb-like DNA-binding protein
MKNSSDRLKKKAVYEEMSDNEDDEDDDEEMSGGNQVMEEGDVKSGRWTDEEHERFLLALKQYGKNWNKVHRFVKTRTSAQTRSHAQKYFNKLTKKNTKEA